LKTMKTLKTLKILKILKTLKNSKMVTQQIKLSFFVSRPKDKLSRVCLKCLHG
jgi:hypothetical protein